MNPFTLRLKIKWNNHQPTYFLLVYYLYLHHKYLHFIKAFYIIFRVTLMLAYAAKCGVAVHAGSAASSAQWRVTKVKAKAASSKVCSSMFGRNRRPRCCGTQEGSRLTEDEGWSYTWSLSLGGGGGVGRSPSLHGAAWASASMKESVERVLMRRGARRRRLLGVHGSLTWARSEGDTILLSSSASANHGGTCRGAMGSRSGMKAGFSIPPAYITFTLWKQRLHICETWWWTVVPPLL